MVPRNSSIEGYQLDRWCDPGTMYKRHSLYLAKMTYEENSRKFRSRSCVNWLARLFVSISFDGLFLFFFVRSFVRLFVS